MSDKQIAPQDVPFRGIVEQALAGVYVSWDDGLWDVYFGPLKLGRLHERQMRIEDAYGRLKRHAPRGTTPPEADYNAPR